MSDKNIEIIKAIKATGECPKTTTVKPTQVTTAGLEELERVLTRQLDFVKGNQITLDELCYKFKCTFDSEDKYYETLNTLFSLLMQQAFQMRVHIEEELNIIQSSTKKG